MKLIFTIIIILFTSSLSAQVPPRDSLIGKWICKDATVIELEVKTKEEWEAAMFMQKAIVSCVFEFNANGHFKWTFPPGAPPMMQELSFLNNRKWIVDQAASLIHIGEPKENLMEIQVSVKEKEVYFILTEMPLKLHVVKSK